MRRIAWSLVLVFSLVACRGDAPPPAPVPDNIPELCQASCERLRSFDCPEGQPTKDYGTPCEVSCEKIVALGYIYPDDTAGPQCVLKAYDLSTIRACKVGCQQ